MPAALLAILIASTPAASARADELNTRCAGPATEKVDTRQPPRIRKLGEMPPARQLLGVYREVNGCPTPVVVRESVGLPRR